MAHALPPEPEQWQPLPAAQAAERLSPAAAWYFAGQWLALDPQQQPSAPIWLHAPELRSQQTLDAASLRLHAREQATEHASWQRCQLVPALASNPVLINQHTLDYLARHSLRVRGERRGEHFLLSTLWPESWRLGADAPVLQGDWRQLIATDVIGAQQPFRCQRLWRNQTNPAPARWAIGFMLNGAQGDDDEAHGGHFALTLGRCRADGSIADWLVANFYNPDVVSEKGILPALVSMDNYLTELNSGQQQYRPSWLVACTLSDEDLASALYLQLLDTFARLYDHRLHYQHTDNNCTGLSMDALRACGIRVPLRGPSSRLLAPVLFFSTCLRERSLYEAQKASRYLLAERTRLMPWQAFEACVEHVLALLTGTRKPLTPIEASLCRQAQAVYGLYFPQLPSARPWGREPAESIFAYQARVPKRRSDWKIIPVPARELPASLRYNAGAAGVTM